MHKINNLDPNQQTMIDTPVNYRVNKEIKTPKSIVISSKLLLGLDLSTLEVPLP